MGIQLNWARLAQKLRVASVKLANNPSLVIVMAIKAFRVTRLSVFSLLISAICSPAWADVVINEIFPNPPGTDPGYEWVELFNAGDVAIDISSWTIDTATSDWSIRFVFPAGTQIYPGDFLVIGDEYVVDADLLLPQGESLILGNAVTSGDAVRIADNVASVIDTVIYGPNNNDGFLDDNGAVASSLALIGVQGESIARAADGVDSDDSGLDFTVSQPTPGQPNVKEDSVFSDGFEDPPSTVTKVDHNGDVGEFTFMVIGLDGYPVISY